MGKDPNKPEYKLPTLGWKRALDLALIALSAPVVLPLFAVIAAWIKLTSKGPVFFKQDRLGVGQKTFPLLKFRSMHAGSDTGVHEDHFKSLKAANGPMTKLDRLGDARLIPGGGLLRASGLDELPQLINVLRGEMSLVGPRPCTPQELVHYSPDQCKRFNALPGLTGLWQVLGKNNTTFNQMVCLDDYYHDHLSLFMDLWIICRTPLVLVSQVLEMQRKERVRQPLRPGPNL